MVASSPGRSSRRVLVAAATEGEVRLLIERLANPRREVHAGKLTVDGAVDGISCLVAVTGLGAVNAAHALTRCLDGQPPVDVVLQVGIAGAYVPAGLSVGDVAIASEEVYGDVGVLTPDGWQPADAIGIPLVDGDPPRFNRFPLDAALVQRASALCGAHAGPFLTLSQVTGVRTVGDALFQRFGALCESMEGAAAAHVCLLYGVPLLEVRGVSNLVEDRDRSKWRIPEAAAAAQAAALRILTHLDEVIAR